MSLRGDEGRSAEPRRGGRSRDPCALAIAIAVVIGIVLWAQASAAGAMAMPTLEAFGGFTLGVGDTIDSGATLTGGSNATGSIKFTLFGPADPTCSGTPEATSTAAVAGDGFYASNGFLATRLGTYNVVAAYSGDASNAPIATACGAAPNTAMIAAAASAPVTVDGSIAASATLYQPQPGDVVVFSVYGPVDENCSAAAVHTVTVPVNGNTANSGPLPTAAPGTYNFLAHQETAGGEGISGTSCGVAGSSVRVAAAVPVIGATTSGPVPVGGAISGAATLSGGFNPTGAITFTLFGPTDPGCAGTPADIVRTSVSGGRATSGAFPTAATGTYNFVAAYGGDANNAAVTTSCGAAAVTAGLATPTIAASAAAIAGGEISDAATLTGAYHATGTMTFTQFGPNDATCGRPPLFRVIAPVKDGRAESTPLSTPRPGRYDFVLAYSGDPANAATKTRCGQNSVTLPGPQVSQGRVNRAVAGVVLRLTCAALPDPNCTGSARLSTVEHFRSGKLVAVTARSQPAQRTSMVSVGRLDYRIPAGQARTIMLPLNGTGRRLKRSFAALPVRLTVTGSTAAGHSDTIAVTRLRVTGQ